MKTSELKKKYLDFFKSKKHAIIPSAPLIPEHDPSVLFTTAGMHPLVPFLAGQKHPLGKRLANAQKCIRTQDIEEVGDETHTTFFEMLGNWSFGDYFKKEAIEFSFEFLTKVLELPISCLAVTCFAGDEDAPRDKESAEIWKSLGIPKEKIVFLGKEDNWWGPAGFTGPCGPDTEMFYWIGKGRPPKVFNPGDKKWVEIWNDVFMEYYKNDEGKYDLLKNRNVDTGLGVERVAMILQGKKNIFEIEVFTPIIERIKEISGQKMTAKDAYSFRIIADHLKAAVFILGDERGVPPSNVDQGYVLRRYIRRSIRHLRLLGVNLKKINAAVELAKIVIRIYQDDYPILKERKKFILSELKKEEERFKKTLGKGLIEFEKMAAKGKDLSGKDAFLLFQSYGFPLEMTDELAKEKGIKVNDEEFAKEYEKHQELSRAGAEKKFKGGLSEASEETKKLHTATHLLNQALRRVLDKKIGQRGSNITPERLRFDFNFDHKLTKGEIKKVEDEVNRVIRLGLKVKKEEMPLDKALKSGAVGEFGAKYPERVTVYSTGKYSKEICMGPHVSSTKELGRFRIVKEESSAAGIRRIKAVLE